MDQRCQFLSKTLHEGDGHHSQTNHYNLLAFASMCGIEAGTGTAVDWLAMSKPVAYWGWRHGDGKQVSER